MIVACLFFAACGDSGEIDEAISSDAPPLGGGFDSGAEAPAGRAEDGGVPVDDAELDGGVEGDSGSGEADLGPRDGEASDAGLPVDPLPDGGSEADGGPEEDGGSEADAGSGPDGGDGSSEPPETCASAVEAEVIRLANGDRARQGAVSFRCDARLAEVARAHSRDMCERGYFSHDNPEGQSPFDRMRAAGIRYSAAGENIAQGQSSARIVHDAWMGSSGHRANILRESFGRIGVGYEACGGRRSHYWTQVFAD